MSWETWTIGSGEDQATVANLGGVLLDWKVTANLPAANGVAGQKEKQTRQLVDGYQSEAEALSRDGSRNAILVPWSNRLGEGRFTFNQQVYDLANKTYGGQLALHGLLNDVECQLVEKGSDYLVLQAGTPLLEDYPFPVEVQIRYQLNSQPHQLDLQVSATNLGEHPAPISIGWHPYFTCVGGKSSLPTVKIPALSQVETDSMLIPLPGNAAYLPVEAPVVLNGRSNLDHGFTQLVAENDCAQVQLRQTDGTSLDIRLYNSDFTQGIGSFHVFTGEPLHNRPGSALAIEPLLTVTDAFNRAECQDFVTVAPQEKQVFHAQVVFNPA